MKKFLIFVPVQTMKKKLCTAVQASCEKHSTEWRLPAATVTTDAKPQAQQQLARDLEVERAVMGQRCRAQSFGEVQRVRKPRATCPTPGQSTYRCNLPYSRAVHVQMVFMS